MLTPKVGVDDERVRPSDWKNCRIEMEDGGRYYESISDDEALGQRSTPR